MDELKNKIIDDVILRMKESLMDDHQTPKLALPLINSKSKFIRSTLLMQVAFINKKVNSKDIIKACSVIELLHLASLIHDDIIDDSSLRRNIPTINSTSGNEIALIAGDYILTKSIKLAYDLSPPISECLIDAFLEICEGQYFELKDQNKIRRTVHSYLNAINGKTATLFGYSLKTGAILAELPQKQINALFNFGINFGIIFQLLDDFLDYFSTEQKLNKPIFQDFKEKNFTYPLIILDKEAKDLILKAKSLEEIIKILIKNNAIQKTIDLINKYQAKAFNDLDPFPKLHFLKEYINTYFNNQINQKINPKYNSYLQ